MVTETECTCSGLYKREITSVAASKKTITSVPNYRSFSRFYIHSLSYAPDVRSSPKGLLTLYLWLGRQRLRGKKTSLSASHPKHRSMTSSSYGATVTLCMGEVGVQRFSRSM